VARLHRYSKGLRRWYGCVIELRKAAASSVVDEGEEQVGLLNHHSTKVMVSLVRGELFVGMHRR
jgi:hypothetical protein